MKKQTHIEEELTLIAPALLKMPSTLPYSIPAGYFAELGNWTASVPFIDKDEIELQQLVGLLSKNPYTVPTGYFEQLNQWVSAVTKIDNQGTRLVGLEGLTNSNVYRVPTGYFESFADSTLALVKQEEVYGQEENGVPAGYFDAMPEFLLQKVRALDVSEELDTIAPLLNSIDKKPVNHLPEGYFEQNVKAPKEIIATTAIIEPATKVVQMQKRTFWMRYAIAACFTGVIGFSLFNLFDNAPKGNTDPIAAGIPTQTSTNVAFDLSKELEKVDVATIEKYLEKNETPSEHISDIVNNKAKDIQYSLQSFSDEALKKHLQEESEMIF